MNHFDCIYMYTNKINGKKYIGQAKDFNKRHCSHKKPSAELTPFHNAIKKYGIENFEIKILAENISTQEKMNEYEIFFIKRYNTLSKNGNGYNISNGGSNGNPFAGKSEEEMNDIRRKISENHADVKGENNPRFGKKLSEEERQKISKTRKDNGKSKGENNPFYGKHHTDKIKEKIRTSLKNKMDKGNNPMAKKVAQFDKDMNLIKVWSCAKEASEELNINHSKICMVCRYYDNPKEFIEKNKYPRKFHKGYIWKYVDGDYNEIL